MRQIIFTALCILLVSSNCKKNNTQDTVTINGETFGCKVDGVVFIADGWDYGNNISPINISISHVSYGGATLRVKARKENRYVEIFVNKPLTKGIHPLNFNTMPYPVYDPPKDNGIYVIENPVQKYITNETIGGYVDLIEIDTLTNKVYGKFEFTGTDKSTNKQVIITNGMFKNY